MKVQVLGPECLQCRHMAFNVEMAVRQLDLACEVQKIQSVAQIAEMGVTLTPALLIDGEIKSEGRLLSVEQIKRFLK